MNEKIDLSKYEGHTEGPWRVEGELTEGDDNMGQSGDSTLSIHGDGLYIGEVGADYGIHETIANAQLIADAPLLFEEVKQSQRTVGYIKELILRANPSEESRRTDSISASIMEAICTKEEYIALGFPVRPNLEQRDDY